MMHKALMFGPVESFYLFLLRENFRSLLSLKLILSERFALLNLNILRTETRHSQGDAVIVFAAFGDVERGVIVARIRARLTFEHVEKPVKTNGAAAIGGKIKT